MLLCEQDATDPVLSRRIGLFLIEDGRFKDAVGVLEKALASAAAGAKPAASLTQLQLDLGRVYFLLARYSDAARLFDKVLAALDKPKDFGLDDEAKRAIVGQDGLTYELIGTTYLEVDRPQSAAVAFAKLNEAVPNRAVAALNAARVEAKAKHPDAALAKLQEYLDSHPAEMNLGALELLEQSFKDLKQSDQLIPRLESLHNAMPDAEAVNWLLAERYRVGGKSALAKPLYEATIKKRPNGDAYRALASLARQAGDVDALATVLGEVSSKSGSLDALGPEGKAILADDKLIEQLFRAVRVKHAAAQPTDYLALRGAGALAAAKKNFKVAEEFYNLAIKANSQDAADVLLNWGLELFLADQDAGATAVFERGLAEGKLAEGKPVFEYYLAGALEMQGKTDAALDVVRRMIATQKPKDTRYAVRGAWIMFHAKRYEAAKGAYRELIAAHDADFDSEETRSTLREAREALSSVCVALHQLPEAEELLLETLDEFPEDVGANNDLGYLWCDQGKHLERSLAMIRKAVAAEPNNASYRDSLGWALFRLGQNDAAVAELKKAAIGDDPDGTIFDHLAEVYVKINQPALAQANWLCALKSFEKQKDAEKITEIKAKLAKLPAVTGA